MTNAVCRDCKRIYTKGDGYAKSGRCPDCTKRWRTAHPELESPTRIAYRDPAERRRRTQAVTQWVAQHGWICPGWHRDPHPSHDLTAAHTIAVANGGHHSPLIILCRSCNARQGTRNT